MKQDIVIDEHKFIQKFLINLCCHGIVIIFIFAFVYGKYYKDVEESIRFLVFISIIEFFGFIFYLLLRRINKNRFIFSRNCVCKFKKNELLNKIENNAIIKILYIRVKWIFLMQFGAGYLIIKYRDDGNYKIINISMSCNDAKRIAKYTNKIILIK